MGLSGAVAYARLTRFRHVWYTDRGLATTYAPICEGPCNASLPIGEHHFALSKDGGRPVPAAPVYIPGPSSLHAEYVDRSGTRTAGVVVGVAGLVGGIVMIAESFSSNRCDANGVCTTDDHIRGGLFGGGIAVIVVSAIVGSVMATTPDHAYLTVTPLSFSPTARARESGDPTLAIASPQGAGLTLRF